MVDDRTMMLRLKDVKLSASHTEDQSSPRTESYSFMSLDALENREIARQHQQALEEPVRCTIRNGMISEIQFSSDEEPWSKNIK